jgi:O-antigen/teichoic acid export membrane protein
MIFAAKILSVATGMIFIFMLTRNTTKEQYGIWSNIFDLTSYFVLLSYAIPFWVTRFVARGENGAAKTGFFANFILAITSIAFYIPIVPFITLALDIGKSYMTLYLIAALQIIELYLINALEAALRVEKPQALGYGLLIEEVCKILLAYIFIVKFQQPLFGAMISLIIAVAIQIAYYMKLLLKDFRQKIRWSHAREWLKGSIANIYNLVGNQLASFIFIMLIVYGGKAARGDYAAAATIANIITYASFISFALYPKLLAENSIKDVGASLRMVLMFTIPMTFGAMAIPDSFLIILDEPYKEASPILFLLAIDAFIITISQFYSSVLFGVEKFDQEAKIPFKKLAKSHIFKVFTLSYVHSAITLPTTYYALTKIIINQPLQAAMCVAIINMTARFAMFLVLYAITRKAVSVPVPWNNVAKYLSASAVMAIVLYILPHPTKITTTLGAVALGLIIYLTLLMAVDKEARMLALAAWNEIKSKFKRKA